MRFLVTLIAVCVWPFGLDVSPPDLGIGSRYMGEHVPPGASDGNPFAWRDKDGNAVVIYVTGSDQEPRPDACDTARPGQNVPEVIVDLAGQKIGNVTLSVFAYCTPTKVGSFNQQKGDLIPKVILRAFELQALLNAVERAGIPRNRVFVAGQSAGGWAGLLVQRWGQAQMGGLIAFAPAFAGHHGRRVENWQGERDRQVAEIGAARSLNALVYGFEKDPFEPPHVMSWLANRPDIDYVATRGDRIDGQACMPFHPHSTVFRECFRGTQRGRILAYLARHMHAPP